VTLGCAWIGWKGVRSFDEVSEPWGPVGPRNNVVDAVEDRRCLPGPIAVSGLVDVRALRTLRVGAHCSAGSSRQRSAVRI